MGNYYATARANQVYESILRAPNTSRKLTLRFEPGNKFDVNAIEVYDEKVMLGHLDRGTAAQVTTLVHKVLDDNALRRLDKTKYHLLANTKVVGSRVYVTIVGCMDNQDNKEK